MVARTPPKLMKKLVAPLDPNHLRETVNKVEKCMARLQELQHITGGTKMVSVVNLSPRSTRGYLRTSLRCKQDSFRIRNANGQKSPTGKLPSQIGEWKRMSLPAMILGETVGEILQASRFAREIVASVDAKAKSISISGDPKTPVTESRRNSRLNPETTELRARRNREKQIIRSDQQSPLLQRAKSRINFKVSGSPAKLDIEKDSCRFPANRVSPKNRPWARKTVIFPNPLFHTSSASQNQKFCRTNSPVIPKHRPTTPHKFLIKTPPAAAGKAASTSSSVVKFQVKIRSPPILVSPTRPTSTKGVSPCKKVSPARPTSTKGVSPCKKGSPATKLRVRSPAFSVSPTRPTTAKRVVSPPKKVSTAAKLRRSFSPSRLASRLVSPLKSRRLSVQRTVDGGGGGGAMMMNMMSGLKQRPMATTTTPMDLVGRRV